MISQIWEKPGDLVGRLPVGRYADQQKGDHLEVKNNYLVGH